MIEASSDKYPCFKMRQGSEVWGEGQGSAIYDIGHISIFTQKPALLVKGREIWQIITSAEKYFELTWDYGVTEKLLLSQGYILLTVWEELCRKKRRENGVGQAEMAKGVGEGCRRRRTIDVQKPPRASGAGVKIGFVWGFNITRPQG